MKKSEASKKKTELRGEALYLALQKQWKNARTLRRDFSGEGKTRVK
jgi:hypothetical protein